MLSVPRSDDVLDGLPPNVRAELEGLLTRLSGEQRAALAQLQGRPARANALLHVLAGGKSDEAFFALATGANIDLLVAARRHAGENDLAELVPVAQKLARAAAARWLHAQATRVESAGTETATLCDQIDRVALTLGRLEIQLLAQQLAAEHDRSPRRLLAVARAAARTLQVQLARAALNRARDDSPNPSADLAESFSAASRLVRAAQQVAELRGTPLDAARRLSLARAMLTLSRARDARTVLVPVRSQARSHLGLASALALAISGDGACPGLPPPTSHALLCATAWTLDSAHVEATALLEQAWESGQSRDREGAEVYLGLTRVVPWLHHTALRSQDTQPASGEYDARIGSLRDAAREATSVSAAFDGLVLFVDALAAGAQGTVNRTAGERMRLDDQARQQLVQRAYELAGRTPHDQYTQAGVLAVSALVMQEQDVLKLIEQLPELQLAQHHRLARATLRLWAAIGRQRHAVAERARAELAALLPELENQVLERSELILMMAEADAAITQQPNAYRILLQVATRLTTDDVPPSLRLRAGIDRAGALSRQGRTNQAVQSLERVVATISPPPGDSAGQDLLTLAQDYLLVLRGRSAPRVKRAAYADKLARANASEATQSATASIRLWRRIWQMEFARQAKVQQCGESKACIAQATQRARLTAAQIDQRVGREVGLILRGGVLSAGTVGATFNFSLGSGLQPIVRVQPRLLAVEFPRSELVRSEQDGG